VGIKILLIVAGIAILLRFLRPYVIGRCPDCGCFKAARSDAYCRECGRRLD